MSRYHRDHPESIEPWLAPLDDVAANQRDEEQREALACWREDMQKRLNNEYPGWRVRFETVDDAAEVLLGKTPYAQY